MHSRDRRIGLYGGTFDPVHHGHLILARAAAELHSLDCVVLIPAAQNPLKREARTAPRDARLEMLRAAVAGEDLFYVDDVELRRPPPSYSIDTIEHWAAREPDASLFFLIGEDNLARMGDWHRETDLRRMVTFIVLNRPGASEDATGLLHVDRHLDFSSTEIRNRVAEGRSIRYLVPEAVRNLIEIRQLYRAR